ncbi:MAG: hypothetical protein IPK26_26650 [Planctomycetes bacterium]|nr:hypothetical protein [Planctomycetota bacterium]
MKLEPVYLVAPRPTRRAFLLAGGAFAGGVVVGGAGGFAIGVNSVAVPTGAASGPTGNPELDELRRLAVSATVEELAGRRAWFVGLRNRGYPDDPILIGGLGRLADRVIADAAFPQRGLCARTLLQSFGLGAAKTDGALQRRIPALQAAAR